MHPQFTPEQVVRFWSKADKDGPIPQHCPELGPCWVWTAARYPNGYGMLGWQDKTLGAHRVAYALEYGPFDPALAVCHKCDNRPCVNPVHLFLGSHQENMTDMWHKGRGAAGERHGAHTQPHRRAFYLHPERHARGASAGAAKLTDADVLAIRSRLAAGERQIDIAVAFGIGQAEVSRIKRRVVWDHLP